MRNITILLFSLIPLTLLSQNCDSLLYESITNPGPYSVDYITEPLGIRNGPDYSGSTIFYPLNNNIECASIVLVPGFMNTELSIQNWGPFLASHGIVTMTIGTNSLLDSEFQRKDALLDAIISLKHENNRSSSPLFYRLDTAAIAVGGFSKGGGGAQLAGVDFPDLKAIIALYPWLDNPSQSDLNHNIPVIIISGQLDAIAPPASHANIHYTYTPNTTNKLKYEVALASHDNVSGPNGGFGEVGKRVFSWLQTYLLNDSCYCPLLLNPAVTASDYITNISCPIINQISEISFSKKKLIKIVDILGRETKMVNQNLFYLYDDGTVEKKIVIN
ncbi:MAG: triacylglycerol lipase [Flavobacteriales bacterium]|nr:triacylglycerol lipase [Flavobacteriales bacterium]|tara:strand:+ start:88948 stop:89940 length:993 start_codon:yes stop_codon:yes gene_type:complete